MSSAWPPPPPGVPSAAGAVLAELWTQFRGLPTWVQVAAWVIAWPVVTALLIASSRNATPLRYGAAGVTLLLGGAVWVAAVNGDNAADDIPVEQAAAAESEAAEATERADAAEATAVEEAEAAAETERRTEAEVAAAEEAAAAEKEATRLAEAETAAAADAEAEAAREAEAAATWTVFNVVDGDTVDVRHADGSEERVRVIGIDTPERGECGFGPSSSAMAALALDQEVQLSVGARDNRDRYDRILRYVDVNGLDAGLALIEDGLAISRYDSRDGYGRHDREAEYIAADNGLSATCEAPAPVAPVAPIAPAPPPPPEPEPAPHAVSGPFKNCTAAREAGAAPVYRGDAGYGSHLDRDNDGVGCE